MERFFFGEGRRGLERGVGRESFYGPCKMLGKEAHPQILFCQINAKGVRQPPSFFGFLLFCPPPLFSKKATRKKKRKIQKQKRKTHHQINHHNIRAKVVLLLFAFAQFVRCEWWKKKRRRRALDFFSLRFKIDSRLELKQRGHQKWTRKT